MPLNVSAKGPPSATVLDTFLRRRPPEMPGHPLLSLPSLCSPRRDCCHARGLPAPRVHRSSWPAADKAGFCGQDGAGVGQDQLSPRVLAWIWGATTARLLSSLRQKKGVPGVVVTAVALPAGWLASRTGQDRTGPRLDGPSMMASMLLPLTDIRRRSHRPSSRLSMLGLLAASSASKARSDDGPKKPPSFGPWDSPLPSLTSTS
jgi:hypothetical protein